MVPKKYMLLLIILILSSFGFGLSGDGQGSSPFYNAGYTTNFTRDFVSIVGQDQYPIICDLDSGTEKELITYEGTTIFIYKLEATGVELKANLNTGKQILAIDCVVDPFDVNLTTKQVIVAHPDTVTGYALSGSVIALVNDYYTFPTSQTSLSDFYCVDRDYETSVDFYCVTGNTTSVFWIPSDTVPFQGFTPFYFNESNNGNIVLDFDSDLIYLRNDDDVKACNIYPQRLDGSDVVCTTLDTPTNLNSDAAVMVGYQLSYGTNVCHIYDDAASTYGDIELSCYNTNSTLFNTVISGSADTTDAYDIFFYDLDINGEIDVCFNYMYNNGLEQTKCYEMDGTEIVGVSQNANSYLRGIGNVKEIDNPYFIYYDFANSEIDFIDVDNVANTDTQASNDDRFFYLDRLDSDNIQEIIGESASGISVYYTPITTTDTITVNEDEIYSGLYGFYNPTCTGTNVNIKAKECINTESCTYTNENTEPFVRERLCTDCAGTSTYYCGEWSYSEPLVNCTFSSIGEKAINIIMETDTNPNTNAYEFNTFNIDVLSTSCDQSEDFVDVPEAPDPTDPTDPEEEEIEIPSTSEILELILAMISIAGILVVVVSVAGAGIHEPIVYLLIILGGLIVFTMAGWLPFEWAIIFIVGCIAVSVVAYMISRARGS